MVPDAQPRDVSKDASRATGYSLLSDQTALCILLPTSPRASMIGSETRTRGSGDLQAVPQPTTVLLEYCHSTIASRLERSWPSGQARSPASASPQLPFQRDTDSNIQASPTIDHWNA